MRGPVSACLLFLAACSATPIGEGPPESQAEALESLRSANISDRAKAYSHLWRQRTDLVRALMHALRSASDSDSTSDDRGRRWQSPKYLAIALLGDVRAQEAVNALARDLKWRVAPRYGGSKPFLLYGQFPAAEGLAKIGGPALQEVLGILHRTQNPLERQLCVWTLIQIEGGALADGQDVARFRVEKAIERCRSSEMKANLEAALEYFDKPDLDFSPPDESDKTRGKRP